MGGASRIERVYFEIDESHIEQWLQPQIKVLLLMGDLIINALVFAMKFDTCYSPYSRFSLGPQTNFPPQCAERGRKRKGKT